MNHYELLQVSRHAELPVIEAAYKALLKIHHPDRGNTVHGETARRLGEAYNTLIDPRSRRRYDDEMDKDFVLSGKRIGDYVVDSFIAEGGFGKTYKGYHVLTGGPVCIKHCNQISPAVADILKNEARAMERLRHVAIPSFRTLIKLDDGSFALVMDFIEGPTLEQLVDSYNGRRERFPLEQAAWITARLVNALSYIHRHGIVHGDLKPQNILVQEAQHQVVIVDFGLAEVMPKRDTGNKGFTDVFAPPEQHKPGNPLVPQTDFFALGKTILFALAQGDLQKTEGCMIPTDVPEAMKLFIHRLVRAEPLQRPDWKTEDLNITVEKMRAAAFGRSSSSGRA